MSEEKEARIISRRDMLKAAGATSVGLLAAACVPQVVEVEKQVVVTVEVEKIVEQKVVETVEVEKVVEKIVEVQGAVAEASPVEVDGALWILQVKDFHPDYNDYVRNEITAYAAEQGWPLDISYIAGFSAGTGDIEKIAAAVEAGDPPDLVLHTLGAAAMRNLYVVQPVTDVVEQIEAVYGPAAPFLAQNQVIDGQWWDVPYHQRAGGGYYRKDAFDAAGIDLQTVRLYTDLRDAALTVSDPAKELFGWGVTVNKSGDGNSIIYRFKTGWGAGYQDETGQFITTNTPEMIEAMTELTNTYLDEKWANMLPPGVLAWNDISNNEAFLGEKVAYTENAGTVYAKAVIDKNPVAEKAGYLKPPGGPVNTEFSTIGSQNWYILRGAKNTDAAKQLVLEFTANLDRMEAMLAASPAYALPAYTNLWEMSAYTQSNPVSLQAKPAALDASGIDARQWPGPPSAAMDALENGGIVNDMVNSILTGTAVDEAVADAHDRLVLLWQEFELPGEPA